MALDGIFLRHLKNEIEKQALGARITQIYQPNRDELVFSLRTFSGGKKLLLSARANSPRVHFSCEVPENPAVPPMFCMLLRKKLGGGRLVGVRQLGCDRVLFLDFECINELGDAVTLTVICEIMGMYSNVIVTGSDGVIIDSLKRVDLSVSSRRLVLPNIRYELPDSQNKANILDIEPEQLALRIVSTEPETQLNKALLKNIQGVSPIVCRELEYKVAEGVTNRLGGALYERLVSVLTEFKELVSEYGGKPYIIFDNNSKPMDFSFVRAKQYGSFAESREYPDFSKALDSFYSERDSRERMRVKSQDLTKTLNILRERAARKIAKQQAELKECQNSERLRIYGDLLLMSLYKIEDGASFAKVENFYSEERETVVIPLDPALSPSENSQKYYRNYQKSKTAKAKLTQQIELAAGELEYFESVLDAVERAENEKELSGIREELAEQGYIRQPKGAQRRERELPPREFVSSDGFKILIGKNNRQNDKLTLKTASKNDVWLHTKDIHGSHTVIITEGKTVPETTLVEAAQLAAYYSKARESSRVPVDYTLVRNVKKPAGAKPGMVIYFKNKTLYVAPKASVENSGGE